LAGVQPDGPPIWPDEFGQRQDLFSKPTTDVEDGIAQPEIESQIGGDVRIDGTLFVLRPLISVKVSDVRLGMT